VSGTPSDYDNYQIKFTWVGLQTKATKTLGVAGPGTLFAPENFLPCALSVDKYVNDELIPPEIIVLSSAEIKRFVEALANWPELQTTTVPPNGALSWQILRPVGANAHVFEHVSSEIGARTVLLLLIDSLDPSRTTELETVIRVKRVFVGDL